VLATDRGGMPEMITAEAGLTLAPDDRAAWTAALRRLADDRALLRVMSAAARARFDAHGTWRETASSILRFLTAALARSPRALH
jgi:glycosyltransferase involved in cell wall biosynthesis